MAEAMKASKRQQDRFVLHMRAGFSGALFVSVQNKVGYRSSGVNVVDDHASAP